MCIVIINFICSGVGTATTLAKVISQVLNNDTTLTLLEYTEFLDSAVLVTGAVLVSTGPCSVENMRISVNASIRKVGTGIYLS